MIDHIYGKPSPTWKRAQVFCVILFWVWRLYAGDGKRRRRRLILASNPNRTGSEDLAKALRYRFAYKGGLLGFVEIFSPYQILLGAFTLVYTVRNLDVILGLQAPEPLARMYSRSYYRASYIAVAFDAGFATAMSVKPKWLRDICSVLFSGYYLIWAQEADEKLRRYRAVCTVEMLRVTWEKTLNPYVRALTYFDRPRIECARKILLPRPKSSKHTKPISAWLFFARPIEELGSATELILDFPGGGFIAMGPGCHEERLRRWAKRTGKPVLSIDYGKAPEYPYPWAIEEGFDVYRVLTETKGSVIGMHSGQCHIVLSGDSAGGNICATIMIHILESETPIPHPVAMVLAYPALDFNFTSWMTPEHLHILHTEQSSANIPGLAEGKNHMSHKSPLSVVNDVDTPASPKIGRRKSWKRALSGKLRSFAGSSAASLSEEADENQTDEREEAQKPLAERVKTPFEEKSLESLQRELQVAQTAEEERNQRSSPIGTRLTMTSRTGYFQDRIISPSMMRAMAILYIGPKLNPNFQTDYYISPILAPESLLAKFPRLYLICGERDPFVDDTVILSGRVKEAKRKRRQEAKQKQMIKIGKVRETLRMSSTAVKIEEDPILYEEEEDWVHMRIIEKWSHGFLNMVGLVLPEAETMVHDMADWIDETFAHAATARRAKDRGMVVPAPSEQSPFAGRPAFNLVKPTVSYKVASPSKVLGSADLGAPFKPDRIDGDDDLENDDEAGEAMLSFSTRRTGRSGGDSSNVSDAGSRDAGLPRRLSKADVARISSAPRFEVPVDLVDPNQAIQDSVRQAFGQPMQPPKSTFAFFGSSRASESPRLAPPSDAPGVTAIAPSRYFLERPSTLQSPRRTTSPGGPSSETSSTTGAAARASRLLNANLTEAELMRRRRMEAVYGISGDISQAESPGSEVPPRISNGQNHNDEDDKDLDDHEGPAHRPFRWGD